MQARATVETSLTRFGLVVAYWMVRAIFYASSVLSIPILSYAIAVGSTNSVKMEIRVAITQALATFLFSF